MAKKLTQINNTTYKVIPKDDPKDRIEVEIGDLKQLDFYPQVKLMRWSNEVNFSIRLKENVYDGGVSGKDGVVEYKKGKRTARLYEKPEIGEDGGFEFEVELEEKPDKNVIEYTLRTKGLNFCYQPELTQEEKDEGSRRPDNVVGSYAVYHKTKGGLNNSKGKDYKVGKAFHIYRPKITDKNGNEVWGGLNIDEGNDLLTVTIPQKFLDEAVYPIIVDPTFGYTSAGASSFNLCQGTPGYYARGLHDTLSENGDVSSISTYMSLAEEPAGFKSAIYLESDNSLQGVTVDDTNSSTGWVTRNMSGGDLAVSAGEYWLISVCDGSDLSDLTKTQDIAFDSDAPSNTGTRDTLSSFTFNDPLENDYLYTRYFSIYATYTPVAAFDAILKMWSGAAWVKALLKRWSGAAWQDQDDEQLKVYHGETWKSVDAGG